MQICEQREKIHQEYIKYEITLIITIVIDETRKSLTIISHKDIIKVINCHISQMKWIMRNMKKFDNIKTSKLKK